MKDSIPDLKIDLIDDGIGEGLILLEQDSGGNVDRVAIHPLHLRYMAEKIGLVESSDPQIQKTIAMLTRRLGLLRDRTSHLANWLTTQSDHKSYEATYATATADLADEFCVELDGDLEKISKNIKGETHAK